MNTSVGSENTTTTGGLTQDSLTASALWQWIWLSELIFMAIIFIFGTSGNIFVILVELKNKIKYSTDYLVISLSSFEIVCATLTPARFVMEYTPVLWKHVGSSSFCQFSWFVGYATGLSSPLLLSAIAVDRFILTCRPLTKWYGVRTGKFVAAGLTIVCVVLSLPSVYAVYAGDHLLCEPTLKHIDLILYTNILTNLSIISFFVITISYIFVGRAIHKRNSKEHATQHRMVNSDEIRRGRCSRWLSCPCRPLFFTNTIQPLNNHPRTDDAELQSGIKTQSSSCTTTLQLSTIQSESTNTRTSSESNASGSQMNNSAHLLANSQKSKLMRKTTLIMFMITLTYVITHTSAWVLSIIPWENEETTNLLMHISAVVAMITCVSNPAYFFLLSSKFRQTAKKILFRK